jgi:hypothetical protein
MSKKRMKVRWNQSFPFFPRFSSFRCYSKEAFREANQIANFCMHNAFRMGDFWSRKSGPAQYLTKFLRTYAKYSTRYCILFTFWRSLPSSPSDRETGSTHIHKMSHSLHDLKSSIVFSLGFPPKLHAGYERSNHYANQRWDETFRR